MQFSEAIKMALQSLWANKLRSVLTLLGMVMGVASVIMVITLVTGANSFVENKFTGYGADVFTLSKNASVTLNADEFLRFQKRKDLLYEDYTAIAQGCRNCTQTGASISQTGKVVYNGKSSDNTGIRGYTSSMLSLNNIAVDTGREFTPTDDDRGSHVCIVGYDIIDNLVGDTDPIGKELRIGGSQFTIIGIGERQGKTFGASQDNWVAIPLSAYMNTFGAHKSLTIYARADENMERAQDQARVILRARRHDAVGAEDSFSLETNSTFLEIWKSMSSIFAGVIVAVAAISLVVGGIVIMNIMLVSVTERTKEIGVRKALGAKRRDVMLQFLIESATMSLIGGAIGILGGVIVAKLITFLVGFPTSVQLWSVLLGLFVATSVGIFFGVYPARKAALLDPIVALRSEL